MILIDLLSVLGEGSYAIRTRLCSPNTLFRFRIFSQKMFLWPPILEHFGGLGQTWLQGGAPGWFWRGLKKRSKKEVLQFHTGAMARGGPYRDSSWDSSWESSRERSRDRARDRLEP